MGLTDILVESSLAFGLPFAGHSGPASPMGLTGIEPVTFAILKHVCEGNVLAAELQARGPTGI